MSLSQTTNSDSSTVNPNAKNYADTIAGKYIIQPKNAKGIGGFVFDYEGETNIRLQAEITDHYSEDNTAINDHIAIRPMRISLRGYSGELVFTPPAGILGGLNFVQDKLTTIPAYLGNYTPQAVANVQKVITKAQNITNSVNQAIARVKNIVGMFPGISPTKTKQEKDYWFLYGLFLSKQIMYVVTPYGTFNNMVIETCAFVQDDTTKSWSDISVTLKQMRFVRVETTATDKNTNRFMKQSQGAVDKGKTQGTAKSRSILATIFGG